MTGRQNVKFVARMHGAEYDVDEIIRRVEDFAEIGRAFDEPIRTYSSGMRARLNFGLSLAFEFDVYLSDEATSVGDRAFKAKATKAFKDKVNQASLIMVSHSEGILKELCEAGVYLKEGQATWYDDVKDAIAAYHADSDVGNSQKRGKANIQERAQAKAQGQGAVDAMASTAASEPPPASREEAQRQLRECRVAFEGAKAAFEQAKADNLIPRERKVFGDAFRAARARLQNAQRNLKALQSRQGDD
jgi:capsular polysaccharide transport system ATP-binding protein